MTDIQSFEPLWGVWYIEAALGEGSYGKVYKARRGEFGRTFYSAIKHISIPKNSTETESLYMEGYADTEQSVHDYYENVVHSLIDEIELLHKLQGNTNIVTYEDHMIVRKKDEPGYDIFIRMELLKGLSDLLRETAVTQNLVIKMAIDICTALEVLGQTKLIHRDIKPANIFVNDNGAFKLGDFGVSRILDKTMSGMSKKGTYNFMAPEVYKGQPYNSTIDIYSLGIVMYRLLNGNRAPFLPLSSTQVSFNDNERAIGRRMMGESLPKPAFADERLSVIILKACSYDPAGRYHTPTDFKEDLLHYAAAEAPKVLPVIKATAENTVGDQIDPVSVKQKRPAPVVGPGPQEITEALHDDNSKTESVFAPNARYQHAYGDPPLDPSSPAQPIQPQYIPANYNKPLAQDAHKRKPLTVIMAALALFVVAATIGIGIMLLRQHDRADKSGDFPASDAASITLADSAVNSTPPPSQGVPEDDAAPLSSSEMVLAAPTSPTTPLSPSNQPLPTAASTPSPDPTPMLIPYFGSLDGYSKEKFVGATASSEVTWDGVYYGAEKAIDSDLTTSWQEDAEGKGIGEYIVVYFEKEADVSLIYLRLGFARETSYDNNAKPKTLLFEFSDGTTLEYSFPEINEDFYLSTVTSIRTSYIKISILDAYEGLKYKDTAITEIAAYSLTN